MNSSKPRLKSKKPRVVRDSSRTRRETPARGDLGPEAYAGFAREWRTMGAEIVGGCCGIGPDHIAELRSRLA